MLKEVLIFINKSGDFKDSEIKKALNISEEMVREYKEQLIRMGYIEKVEEGGCQTEACSKCSHGCNSKTLNNVTQWKISDKGMKIINR